MKNWRYIIYTFITAIAILFPFYTGTYLQHTASTILIYLSLALSWDMLLRAGQISFGIAGFFGIGGYAAALTHLRWGIDPFLSIILGGLAAFFIAFLLGLVVLHLRGLYFAIVTLAIAEIFRVIVRNLHSLTGGPEGSVLPSAIFNGDPSKVYWLVLTLAIITIIVSEVFQRTRIHFATTTIRNDELVAKSSGINIFKYLVFIFAITSALQGMIGASYTHQYAFVTPEETFHIHFTLLPIAMCLLGGMYTTIGPVVGALVLGTIADYLKLQLPYGHLLVYGIVIVVVILFAPKGIVGTLRERLEKGK